MLHKQEKNIYSISILFNIPFLKSLLMLFKYVFFTISYKYAICISIIHIKYKVFQICRINFQILI